MPWIHPSGDGDAYEGDWTLGAEAGKKSRILPGVGKGDVEDGASGYSSLLDTGHKEPSGYLQVYQNERPAERLRECPWVLVPTTGCKFTFLTRLGKHCLAGLWLTSPQQQCVSTEAQTVLYSSHNPYPPRNSNRKRDWEKLEIIQSSTDFNSLLFFRLLNDSYIQGLDPTYLRAFPLLLKSSLTHPAERKSCFFSHEEVHSE